MDMLWLCVCMTAAKKNAWFNQLAKIRSNIKIFFFWWITS